MRQANKLGLLGLAVALVPAFGIIGGLHGTSKVQAQAIGPKTCGEPIGGSTPSTFTPGRDVHVHVRNRPGLGTHRDGGTSSVVAGFTCPPAARSTPSPNGTSCSQAE